MNKTTKLPLNKGHTLITLSINQYNKFIDFLEKHKECLIVQNKYDRLGAINNSYTLLFDIKNKDGTFVTNVSVKCVACGKVLKLSKNSKIDNNTDINELQNKYHSFIKYTLIFLNDEANKFNEIFEKNNGNVNVEFIPCGLSNSIFVNGEEITNNDTW